LRLIVTSTRPRFLLPIDREIRNRLSANWFVCLFVLLGALICAEKLIIRPIEIWRGWRNGSARATGSVRAARNRLPAEFIPLARAFNAMARSFAGASVSWSPQRTADRDRPIDMLSGLATGAAFQSRLDFEWMKAQQYDSELSLLR